MILNLALFLKALISKESAIKKVEREISEKEHCKDYEEGFYLRKDLNEFYVSYYNGDNRYMIGQIEVVED